MADVREAYYKPGKAFRQMQAFRIIGIDGARLHFGEMFSDITVDPSVLVGAEPGDYFLIFDDGTVVVKSAVKFEERYGALKSALS